MHGCNNGKCCVTDLLRCSLYEKSSEKSKFFCNNENIENLYSPDNVHPVVMKTKIILN